MDIKYLKFNIVKEAVESILEDYSSIFGKDFKFCKVGEFKRREDKPYHARTDVGLLYNGQKIAEMVAILFAPKDGTGDTTLFNDENKLIIPQEYKHENMQHRVFPRSKKGIIAEVCIPLFSIGGGMINYHAISLEELTSDGSNRLIKAFDIGITKEALCKPDLILKNTPPKLYLTTGFNKEGKRFGDPHAIYNNTDKIQVAGFISVKEASNTLSRILLDYS